MSWTSRMTREIYLEGDRLKLFRHKTKRWISVHFSDGEPIQIVSKVGLDTDEMLSDRDGTKVRVIGYDGFSDKWTYKPISIEIVEL